MNCPNCTAPMEYRFSTICSYCESEFSTSEGMIDDCRTLDSPRSFDGFVHDAYWHVIGNYVRNGLLILFCSGLGSVLGGLVMWFTAGLAAMAIIRTGNPSDDCAAGAAVTMLSLLTGGFLGCIGGTIGGYRNIIRRRLITDYEAVQILDQASDEVSSTVLLT